MKPANSGPFYAAGLYPKLAEVFRAHGYALAVHGSLANDFDLIAVPWVDEAGEPDKVIEELFAKYAFSDIPESKKPNAKPHDRVAYKLHLSFGNCALDISFTPRTGKWAKLEVTEVSPSNAVNEKCEVCGGSGTVLSGAIGWIESVPCPECPREPYVPWWRALLECLQEAAREARRSV